MQFELAKVEFETELHKHFKENFLDKNDQVTLAKNLVKVFDNNLHRAQTSAFTSDKNLRLTNYDQLMYLTAIAATNATQFYNKYRKIIMDPSKDFKFAPIFSQEYAVRIGYAQFLEPDLFTEVLKEVKAKAQNSDDQYVKNKPILDRIYTILGGAGTGKTTAVDFLLTLMIADDKRGVIAVGASDTQANSLQKAIKGANKVLSKDKLMKAIKGDQVMKYKLNEQTQHIELDTPIAVSEESLWAEDIKNRILVIDEITFYDEQELQLLNEYATKHNAIIIGSGDNKQNGKILNVMFESGKSGTHMSGIEDGLFITSPTLVATMRAGNLASLENVTRLESILRHAINASIESDNDPQVAVKEIEEWLKANKGLTLDYFEDPQTKDVAGEKIVATIEEAKAHLTNFKQLVTDPKSQIAVITNDAAKYAGLDVEVIAADKVQGGEFDYVIIDVN
ncbi:MAG: AAA family ATPase [Methanobrevibacter sp.]|nr:AAA family ATPase [Methanobrevibacter sp.]